MPYLTQRYNTNDVFVDRGMREKFNEDPPTVVVNMGSELTKNNVCQSVASSIRHALDTIEDDKSAREWDLI